MRRFFTFVSGDGPPLPLSSDADRNRKASQDEATEDLEGDIVNPTSAEPNSAHLTPPPSPQVVQASETDDTQAPAGSPHSTTAYDKTPDSPVSTASESPAINATVRLRGIVAVLRAYADEASDAVVTLQVVAALKDLAEVMVWADQNDPNVWDIFLEFAVMPLLVRCLQVSAKSRAAVADRQPTDPDSVVSGQEQVSEQRDSAYEHEEEEDREFSHISHGIDNSPAKVTVRPNPTSTGDLPNTSIGMSGRRSSALSFTSSVVEADSTQPENNLTKNGTQSNLEDEVSDVNDGAEVQAQLLQTLSIVIQSVSQKQSLLCVFSSNHINQILSFEFDFEHDEMLAYYISAVKSIALKLDEGLLQLFFDPMKGSFPLYTAVTKFFDHREAMVRIAIRNVTLTIYALGDSEVLRFAAKDETQYFPRTVDLLARLCGSVARAFEFLLDDGREVQRTRSRTGLFRRRVKISELTAKLEEIENISAYLGDVSTVSQAYLHPLIVNLISKKLFSPFFRPLSSHASPASLQLPRKRWGLRRKEADTETKPALPLFDAAARALVLTCMLTHCKTSPLGSMLVRDLCRPTADFEHRHVLHGLKGMATNIKGTERVTVISLCAIEAFIRCEAASKQLLANLKYDFFLDDIDEAEPSFPGSPYKPFINIGVPDEDDLQRRGSEPLLMTLSDFEAPLTPTGSRPSTPTLASNSSFDGTKTPPNGLFDSRYSSMDSSPGFQLSPSAELPPVVERSDSDGIISSFQFGETSLREALSSIVLVVRRREVRTVRVLHAISRIISSVNEKTSDINSCIDITKIMLDELAGVIHEFLQNKRTTIVAIEQMFDNFLAATKDEEIRPRVAMDLEMIVSPDHLPVFASEFLNGAGMRRRVNADDTTPPVEIQDAQTFCILANVYDEMLRSGKVLGRLGSLSERVVEILKKDGVDDSYLDKRDALEQISEAVLKHGEL